MYKRLCYLANDLIEFFCVVVVHGLLATMGFLIVIWGLALALGSPCAGCLYAAVGLGFGLALLHATFMWEP